MYSNTNAVIRPDLMALLEQGQGADSKNIASKVLPPRFSKRPNGEYHFAPLSTSGLLETELGDSTKRAPKSGYKRVDRTIEKKAFQSVDRGLEEVVDDSDAALVAPSFAAEAFSSKLIQRNMALSYEKRVADLFMSTGTFGAGLSPTAAYIEANIATIDFAADLLEAVSIVEKRGELVNTVILSNNLWKRIRRSTLLRKYLFGDLGGSKMVTLDELSKAFSEANPITFEVARASYSMAKKGKAVADADLAYVWGDDYIWVGRTDQSGDRAAVTNGDGQAGVITIPDGVGSTIVWEEQANSLFVAETYRQEQIRSDVVRVRQFTAEHIFNANAGKLITTNFA